MGKSVWESQKWTKKMSNFQKPKDFHEIGISQNVFCIILLLFSKYNKKTCYHKFFTIF